VGGVQLIKSLGRVMQSAKFFWAILRPNCQYALGVRDRVQIPTSRPQGVLMTHRLSRHSHDDHMFCSSQKCRREHQPYLRRRLRSRRFGPR
jgi:hypothetical protein